MASIRRGFLFAFSIFGEMSSAVKILPHYTYDDYVQWEGKWEVIDGIPYAMSPAPTPKHQLIANTLGALFYNALKNCKHCKAYQAIDYLISNDTVVQPDVSVICQSTKEKFIDFPPSLVVEILSPSTALKDRHTKFSIYESQKIPYYLVVSPDTEEVEIYVITEGGYQLSQKGSSFQYNFQLEEDCSAQIDFSEIWK